MKGAFIYVDAGKGHYVPAIALRDAYQEMGGSAVVEDLFVVFKSPFVHWCSKNYWRFLLHHPRLEKRVNKVVDNRTGNVILRNFKYDPVAFNNFKRWFEKEKPDFIVTTNFMGAALLPQLIKRLDVNCPVFDYAADLFDQVKSGIDSEVTKVYVPTVIGVENTIRMGQPASTVELSPFPLSSKFEKCAKLTKAEARKQLKLKEKFTILCNLGGEGIGSPDFLYGLVERGIDVQVVVIGGKSKQTERSFNLFMKKNPGFDLEMRGFVDNPQEYIMACDMQMGKAGANSLMESLYLKRPFLVSEVLYMARSTQLFFDQYYCGWCEDILEKKLDIIEKCVTDRTEMARIEKNMNDLPVVFSAGKLMELVLRDTQAYLAGKHVFC